MFRLNAAVTPSSSSYARTRIASSFTISVCYSLDPGRDSCEGVVYGHPTGHAHSPDRFGAHPHDARRTPSAFGDNRRAAVAHSEMKRLGEMVPDCRLLRVRRTELPVDTVELARYLIGKIAVHDTDAGRLSGRIVETEAYPVGDSAGHAFRGKTGRNGSLFLGPGHAYVYFIYGSSFMLNVTSEVAGVGGGVLLRALEPLEGIDVMQRYRGAAGLLDLARGPGRLTQAMQITLRQDGLDLCAAGPLWLAANRRETGAIGKSLRIGLTRNVRSKIALLRARQSVREWSKEVTRVVWRSTGVAQWLGFCHCVSRAWNEPLQDRRLVRWLDVEGDGQADLARPVRDLNGL